MTAAAPLTTHLGSTSESSDYHLSDAQLNFYDTHGYLVLRKWITGDLLKRVQVAGAEWIEDGHNHPENSDFLFADRAVGRVMWRVDYVHEKGQIASLELLGSPQVLSVVESMCGPNFVPTYESMVFKQAGDGEAIPWHQDAVHPRTHRIFNMDIYLDSSVQGGGALRVIPGSHTSKADICSITDTYGWDHPDAIYVEMEPGDVLLHDVMVVHGSEHVAGKALRRTIYYEFRAAEEIDADGPWDREWVIRRMKLIPLGMKAFAQRYPDVEPFRLQVTAPYAEALELDAKAELKIAHVKHMNGAYCSAGDAGKKTV